MNILIPQFNLRRALNGFWRAVRTSGIAKFVCHEAQAVLAYDLMRGVKDVGVQHGIAAGLFGLTLRGAGYSWESRRWLNPVTDTVVDATVANNKNFNCFDWFGVSFIAWYFQNAGSVTLLVADFDLYGKLNGTTLLTDKLDTVNGVLTAPSQAAQAAGSMVYKDIGNDPGEIAIAPGQSIQAIVTTTVTGATQTMPIILGFPMAETPLNLSTAYKSS
jgi:hypothetical protein